MHKLKKFYVAPISAIALSIASGSQASAAEMVGFNIIADVFVTETTSYGPVSNPAENWPESCLGQAGCQVSRDYTETIYFSGVRGTSDDGINFSFYARGDFRDIISGTAEYLGAGAYRGISLSYYRDYVGSYQTQSAGVIPTYVEITGSTSQFSIFQVTPPAVPEPSTWVMLILGFFGIGGLLRLQRRNRNIAVSCA